MIDPDGMGHLVGGVYVADASDATTYNVGSQVDYKGHVYTWEGSHWVTQVNPSDPSTSPDLWANNPGIISNTDANAGALNLLVLATSEIGGEFFGAAAEAIAGWFEAADVVEDGTGAVLDGGAKPSTITDNAAKGKDFEGVVTKGLEDNGHTNIAEQVTVKPNGSDGKTLGNVRLDNLSTKDGKMVLTDAKSSETAGLTPNQKTGYPALEKNGGTVVGNNGADLGYPAGTKIPPTKVSIVRPQ